MKVVEVNATYGIGSTGLIVRDIGDALKADGDEVRFACQTGDFDPREGYRIGSPADWKLHALYTRLSGRQGWASRGATAKFLKYLDAEQPDVVHLHNLHANYINLPMLLDYLGRSEIATVVTLHDCWFFTGKCCHFAATGCERWKNGCGHCPKRRESPRSLFFDSSAYVAEQKAALFHKIKNLTVVGCSRWIAELAENSFVFGGCHVEQIYNGVDTGIFAPMDQSECRKRLGLPEGFLLLGMANKWLDPGNDRVFRAVVSQLRDDETLVLVGCNAEQQQILNGCRNVIAVDFIRERHELAGYYNSADVFVNLTFEDTLPTVNMESICCGTPVITYDSSESPELVLEGKTGYVIPQTDDGALIAACGKIREKRICREFCRETGLARYDKRARYDEYVSLFVKSATDKRIGLQTE